MLTTRQLERKTESGEAEKIINTHIRIRTASKTDFRLKFSVTSKQQRNQRKYTQKIYKNGSHTR